MAPRGRGGGYFVSGGGGGGGEVAPALGRRQGTKEPLGAPEAVVLNQPFPPLQERLHFLHRGVVEEVWQREVLLASADLPLRWHREAAHHGGGGGVGASS